MKRVLIFSGSIGEGHNQAAKALQNYLLKQNSQLSIKVEDFLEIEKSTFNGLIKKTYLNLINKVPFGYKFIYDITEKQKVEQFVKKLLIYNYRGSILNCISSFQPDLIVFTHPFPAAVFSYLKSVGLLPGMTSGIIVTDFSMHPVWVHQQIDYYFVGTNDLKEELISKGIHEDKIFVTGIPIREEFYDFVERWGIIKKLGLSLINQKVLLMGGGLGLGSMEEVIEVLNSLTEPLDIIIVTGKNQLLKNRIEKKMRKSKHKLIVLGYCENISELMTVSDLLISKAGGITTSEALAKGLPLLIYKPLPGHEEKNAAYLEKKGLAYWLKNKLTLEKALKTLLVEHPRILLKIRHQKKSGLQHNAVEMILDVILKNLA